MLSMQEVLEICKTYGASVKEGSGHVTVATKEFKVYELFKSAQPQSEDYHEDYL